MGFLTATRRLTAGIAMFAMLLAGLAPAITSALSAANGQHTRWVAVCTADGARLVSVPTDADGVPVAPKTHAIDHCPFCSPGAAAPMLPPTAAVAVPLTAGSDPVPPLLLLLAPRPLFTWAAVQPRAPPRAS
ncbi:MAG: DUF2946 domain-containing protein [Betaproteobacteria bacterium]|nr:DUF2946 domain-containing protein [Betaproteobacteria bacterium]